MAGMGFGRRLWLTRFSKPAIDRPLYRHVLARKPARILQVGIASLDRTERLLRVAAAVAGSPIHVVGLDRFEGRLPSEPAGPTLKQAHQRLHGLASTQLVPGNADTSLARLCNHLGIFDLVLIDAVTDQRHMERCWFFIQRITNPASLVLAEIATAADRPASWQVVTKTKIDELASRTVLRRAG
jgi:hypothetical protein